MKNTLKYVGLILIFTVTGFLIWDIFFELSLSQIANGNIEIISQKIGGKFNLNAKFALIMGIIPLLYLIIRKITKLKFNYQSLISITLIILSGTLTWQFRIFQLNNQFDTSTKLNPANQLKTQINLRELNFELYIFIGFIIGTFASILIFKNNRIKKLKLNKKETE